MYVEIWFKFFVECVLHFSARSDFNANRLKKNIGAFMEQNSNDNGTKIWTQNMIKLVIFDMHQNYTIAILKCSYYSLINSQRYTAKVKKCILFCLVQVNHCPCGTPMVYIFLFWKTKSLFFVKRLKLKSLFFLHNNKPL